jgi:hypothetical protein
MRSVVCDVLLARLPAVAFSAVQPHRLEVLKAALNVFVAEKRALEDIRA